LLLRCQPVGTCRPVGPQEGGPPGPRIRPAARCAAFPSIWRAVGTRDGVAPRLPSRDYCIRLTNGKPAKEAGPHRLHEPGGPKFISHRLCRGESRTHAAMQALRLNAPFPDGSNLPAVGVNTGGGGGVVYRQRLVGVRHAASATGWTRLGNRHHRPSFFTPGATPPETRGDGQLVAH
jgi:hypothetical protein